MPIDISGPIIEYIEDNLDEMARDYVAWSRHPQCIIAPGSTLAIARDAIGGGNALSIVQALLSDRVIHRYVTLLDERSGDGTST